MLILASHLNKPRLQLGSHHSLLNPTTFSSLLVACFAPSPESSSPHPYLQSRKHIFLPYCSSRQTYLSQFLAKQGGRLADPKNILDIYVCTYSQVFLPLIAQHLSFLPIIFSWRFVSTASQSFTATQSFLIHFYTGEWWLLKEQAQDLHL